MRTAYKCQAYPDQAPLAFTWSWPGIDPAMPLPAAGRVAGVDHDVIVLDLAVQNMIRNRSRAKAIADCGADVRHSGSSRVRSAVKQESQGVSPGIPVLQGGE